MKQYPVDLSALHKTRATSFNTVLLTDSKTATMWSRSSTQLQYEYVKLIRLSCAEYATGTLVSDLVVVLLINICTYLVKVCLSTASQSLRTILFFIFYYFVFHCSLDVSDIWFIYTRFSSQVFYDFTLQSRNQTISINNTSSNLSTFTAFCLYGGLNIAICINLTLISSLVNLFSRIEVHLQSSDDPSISSDMNSSNCLSWTIGITYSPIMFPSWLLSISNRSHMSWISSIFLTICSSILSISSILVASVPCFSHIASSFITGPTILSVPFTASVLVAPFSSNVR